MDDDASKPARTDEDTALLVLRIWVEGGSLRARVTEVMPLIGSEPQVTFETSVDAACARVRNWMARFLAGRSTASPTEAIRVAPWYPEGGPSHGPGAPNGSDGSP